MNRIKSYVVAVLHQERKYWTLTTTGICMMKPPKTSKCCISIQKRHGKKCRIYTACSRYLSFESRYLSSPVTKHMTASTSPHIPATCCHPMNTAELIQTHREYLQLFCPP